MQRLPQVPRLLQALRLLQVRLWVLSGTWISAGTRLSSRLNFLTKARSARVLNLRTRPARRRRKAATAAITTIAVSLIYILTIAIVGQLTENYIIFLLAGFAIYLAPFKMNWYYQGIEDFGFITFRSLIIRTLSVLLLFVLVREKSDLILYIILNVVIGLDGVV